MMTNEENKEYDMHGKELKHYFKKTVGRLLMEERMAKNLHLEEVSQKTSVSNGGHFSYSLNLFLKEPRVKMPDTKQASGQRKQRDNSPKVA